MSKGFKITLIVIFSIIGAVVIFAVTVNSFMYINEYNEMQGTLKYYSGIVEYVNDNYNDDLDIIDADGRGGGNFEILVSDDFESNNEEISTKLFYITQKLVGLNNEINGINDNFRFRFVFSENYLDNNKYIVFEYRKDRINDISLNFAITQKELDKLSENNTKVHGYSLK
jgi:hypothetical protein